ncbi:MAG: aspartyl protease [Leptolyngbyaceae cyanobacterium CRU_2_3]|nr:aspartyl protease [Leptolyngbyaceae cyanobacterium CRU_2_3]
MDHSSSSSAPPAAAITSSTAAASEPAMTASPKSSVVQVDSYNQAITRASNAFSMSQLAQSSDDWRLVAGRWQQAIQIMTSIPQTSSRHSQAQKKLTEYRRNLAYAQRQANRTNTTLNPDGVIVLSPRIEDRSRGPLQPTSPQNLAFPPQQTPGSTAGQPRVFAVPIVRRAGNTPVVNVTFNGSQTFEMIVDTGASGTLITRSMADNLRLIPVAQASVDTASQRNVTVPLGYVSSMEVGGVTAQHVLVAVAGPELGIGLLGHDFFGRYDVTIRENQVEFSER